MHPLNEKALLKKLDNQQRLCSDFKLYKTVQREVYGKSQAIIDDDYNFPIDTKARTKLRGSELRLPSDCVIRANK